MKNKKKVRNPSLVRLLENRRKRRMGKYLESLGVWKHTIGGIEHELTPKMGDNDKIASIVQSYSSNKDVASLMKGIRRLYIEFVKRDYPELQESDIKELEVWAEMNQNTIMEEMLIAYKWQTKDDIAKAKSKQGDMVKNLVEGSR